MDIRSKVCKEVVPEPLEPPITMRKLSETWHYGHVVSTFEVQSPALSSSVTQPAEWSPISLSGSCGFGWKFGFQTRIVEDDSPRFQLGVYLCTSGIKESTASYLDVQVKFRERTLTAPAPKVEKVRVRFSSLGDLTKVASSETLSSTATSPTQIVITVTFPTDTPTLKPASTKIYEALDESLHGKEVIDTRFCLLSRRGRNGRVYGPRSVYACSRLLMGFSSELDDLLSSSGFRESSAVDLDSQIRWESTGEDIGSDSDLDPDEFESESTQGSWDNAELDVHEPSSSRAKGKEKLVGEEETSLPSQSENDNRRRLGKQIVVKEVAFRTWKALILYLYKGEIHFTPEACSRSESSFDSGFQDNPSLPWSCSPKSMYALADRFGLQDLKTLAFQETTSRVTEMNIADELFSKFTSKYSEIQETLIKFANEHYHTRIVATEIRRKIEELVDGEHQHAKLVFREFLKSLRPGDPAPLEVPGTAAPEKKEETAEAIPEAIPRGRPALARGQLSRLRNSDKAGTDNSEAEPPSPIIPARSPAISFDSPPSLSSEVNIIPELPALPEAGRIFEVKAVEESPKRKKKVSARSLITDTFLRV